MRDSITKILARYGLPFVGVALAVWLRVELEPSYLDRVPFLLPFIVVLAAAWFAGLGPGLLATAVSVLFATVYPVLGWIDGEPAGWGAAAPLRIRQRGRLVPHRPRAARRAPAAA